MPGPLLDKFSQSRIAAPAIAGLTIACLVAICAVVGMVLYGSRNDATLMAQTVASNTVSAVGHDIARNIELIDLSLQAVQDGAENAEIMALKPSLIGKVLFDRAATAHGVGPLTMLDEHGHVVLASDAGQSAGFNLSGEEFFQVHVSDPFRGLRIGHASISPLDGQWTIALSRRIDRPDGSFAGVVFGSLRATYLRRLFGGLDVGRGGSISLIGTDGIILMRHPLPDQMFNRPLNRPDLMGRMIAAGSGRFDDVSSVDGVRRRYTFERLGTLPLLQVVGQSVEELYANWLARATTTGISVGLLGAVILLLLGRLTSELRLRAKAEAELAVLATVDALTGVANRRQFDAVLEREWRRTRRTRQALALLMLDVDYFKAYNDRYGHQAGDAALAALSALLSRTLSRPADLVARYGGEEFVILLPDTDAAGALHLAEVMRQSVADLGGPHQASPFGVLSVSIGVAALTPDDHLLASDLVGRADRALYRAKTLGRNRSVPSEEALADAA